MNDTVLVISGLDPTGGAGIAADIETINQFGVTPLSIVTTLTVQNTQSIQALQEVDSELIVEQFNHLKDDINISTVKIGILSSAKQVGVLADLLATCKNLNVILDPIVSSGAQDKLLNDEALSAIKQKLLPLTYVLTPNVSELQSLAPDLNEAEAVKSLGCEWVLLTTTDSSSEEIEHRLYHDGKLLDKYRYQKLPGLYHGSGCTLSSAISALIASGVSVSVAVKRALEYTYQTLLNAKQIGKMQYHPNRTKG